MISVFGVLIVAMFVLVRAPQSTQIVMTPADLTPVLPTPVDARNEFIADGRRVGVDVLQLDDGTRHRDGALGRANALHHHSRRP